MKRTTLLLPLLLTATAPAAIVQYTDPASFLAALNQPGAFFTDFSSLSPGDTGVISLFFSGGTPNVSLTIESRNADNTLDGNFLWVADDGDLDRALGVSDFNDNQLLIAAAGLYAIAGNWFLGDIGDNYLAGSVTLEFSDASTFDVDSDAFGNSWRGYISDTPLTGLWVRPTDPDQTDGWVTVDNLTAAVPEPSAALLGGLAAIGTLLRRRKNS